MLYFGAGVREVMIGEDRAMQLFPDFSDPQQFYYLPNFPRLALMEDGSAAIRLFVFREDLDELDEDDEDAVGFISLDVDLRWQPEDVEEAASRIRMEDGLDTSPRLAPVQFSAGSVRLMLLDVQTPEDNRDDVEATDFVVDVLGAGTPSLYGDNRAIFQSRLTKKGVSAISGSLGGMLPIGVVYSLTFTGLQDSFNITASVEWEQIHHHFSTRENTNVLFYEKDIREIIDEFEDNRLIDVDVTVGGIGTAAMDAEREQVLTLIRQLIFDKFFEATLEPLDPAGGGTAGDVTDVIRTIGQDAVTIGMGYSYMQKEVTLEEVRTLDIDWTARKATERTIYPQAHLHTLVGDRGLTIDDLRTVIDADALFEKLPIDIVVHAAWDTDGIASVTVDAGYRDPATDESRMFTESLTKERPSAARRDWADRTNGTDFWYRYEVVFVDRDVPGPSLKLRSGTAEEPWRHHTEGTVVTITPQELYERHELNVLTVQDFPFERWPSVQVFVRHTADDGSFRHQFDEVLTSDKNAFATLFRTDADVPGSTEFRLRFAGASGEMATTQWAPIDGTTIVVTDPRGEDLNIRVVVVDDWSQVSNVLVNLRYVDEEHGIDEDHQLSFTSETGSEPGTWDVHLGDPNKRRFSYDVTLVTTAGDVISTGWTGHDSETLILGREALKRIPVDIEVAPFGERIGTVEVAVRYEDAQNSVLIERPIAFAAAGRQRVVLEVADPTRRSYEVTTSWRTTTGFETTQGPVPHTGSQVLVAGTPPGSQ